jgi:hypothetical protein
MILPIHTEYILSIRMVFEELCVFFLSEEGRGEVCSRDDVLGEMPEKVETIQKQGR